MTESENFNKETTRLYLSTNFILSGYTSLFRCLNCYLSTYSCKQDLFPERGKRMDKKDIHTCGRLGMMR